MLVTRDFNVLIGEPVDVKDVGVQIEFGEVERCPTDLQFGLFQVVEVKMGVSKGVDKHPRFESANLRHHVGEKGVGCDVERHAEEHVCTSLIQLTIQPTVGDMELKKGMARHEGHGLQLTNVPC